MLFRFLEMALACIKWTVSLATITLMSVLRSALSVVVTMVEGLMMAFLDLMMEDVRGGVCLDFEISGCR